MLERHSLSVPGVSLSLEQLLKNQKLTCSTQNSSLITFILKKIKLERKTWNELDYFKVNVFSLFILRGKQFFLESGQAMFSFLTCSACVWRLCGTGKHLAPEASVWGSNPGECVMLSKIFNFSVSWFSHPWNGDNNLRGFGGLKDTRNALRAMPSEHVLNAQHCLPQWWWWWSISRFWMCPWVGRRNSPFLWKDSGGEQCLLRAS